MLRSTKSCSRATLLLLLLVEFELSGVGLLPQLGELGVVAGVPGEAGAVQLTDRGHQAVQEVAVVGDDEQRPPCSP